MYSDVRKPGCSRGIVVNDRLQTITAPRIHAVEECAAHRGIADGLVAPLFEQGRVCATHLAQFGVGRSTGSQTSTKLKVTGIDRFSAGDFLGGEGCKAILLSNPYAGVDKKLAVKDDELIGARLDGDTVDGSWSFKLLRDCHCQLTAVHEQRAGRLQAGAGRRRTTGLL